MMVAAPGAILEDDANDILNRLVLIGLMFLIISVLLKTSHLEAHSGHLFLTSDININLPLKVLPGFSPV